VLFGGWRTFAHGDLHERIAGLTEQLAAGVTNAALLIERADLRRQHGEFAAALVDANEAGRLRPDWAAPQLQRARILFDREQFAEAQVAADATLKLEAGNPDARVIRSRCLAHFGRTNEAIAELQHVLTQPGRALPDLYLERARLQAGAGAAAAAVTGLDEGIRKLGNTPSLALPALEYERQQGAWDAALMRLQTMQTFLPQLSRSALRGEILLQAGRRDEARQVFEEALTQLDHGTGGLRLTATQLAAVRTRLQAGLAQATDRPVTPTLPHSTND
jgi:tetratricopeptide (TPR) repeat protein